MSEPAPRTKPSFEYTGQLIFNEIYEADRDLIFDDSILTDDQFRERLQELLSGSSHTGEKEPRTNYRNRHLADYLEEYNIEEDSKLSSEHIELAHGTAVKKFTHREFGREVQLVDENNQQHTGTRIFERTALIYWAIPDLVFIQGSKKNTGMAFSDLTRRLGREREDNKVALSKIEFGPLFILWVIYQFYKEKEVTADFRVESIEEVKVQGEREMFGKSVQVSGSTNILRSTPLIEGLLKGQLPVQIEAVVKIKNKELLVNISEEGRVHVLADADASNADQLERALLALYFVHEFTSFYRTWKRMGITDKIVTPKFAETLYDIAKEENVDIQFTKQLAQILAEERGESIDDWDLQFDQGA